MRPFHPSLLPAATALLALGHSVISTAHAASASWINPAATGNWGLETNWSPEVIPNGIDDVATFEPTAAGLTVTNNVTGLTLGGITVGATANKSVTINSGTITLATTTGTPTIQLLNATTTGMTFGSVLAGTNGLTVVSANNSARINLNGANTVSGQFTLSSGTLVIGNNAALGASGDGNEFVMNGGGINFGNSANRTIAKSFIVNGGSGFTRDTGNGLVAVTVTGNIQNNLSPSTVLFSGGGGAGNATGSPITTYTVDGVVSGNGFAINASGGGNATVVTSLRSANTFSGNITVSAGGAGQKLGYQGVLIGNDNALSTSTVNFQAGAQNALLASDSDTARTVTNNVVWTANNSGSGNVTNLSFNVGAINAIANPTGGTTTTVSGSGNLTIGGFQVSAGAGAVQNNRALNVTGNTVFSVDGVFSRTGTLAPGSLTISKIGTGTLSLDNAGNTFDGILSVAAGTLRGAGRVGQVSVLNGGTIAGGKAGVVGSTFTLDGSLAAGPALTLEAGAAILIDLSGTTASSLALVNGATGDIVFNGNVVNFNLAGPIEAGDFTLFTATSADNYAGLTIDGFGTITGGLSVGTGLEGYEGSSLKLVGNDIVVTVVPEPGTIALLAMGLLTVVLVFRRRAVRG